MPHRRSGKWGWTVDWGVICLLLDLLPRRLLGDRVDVHPRVFPYRRVAVPSVVRPPRPTPLTDRLTHRGGARHLLEASGLPTRHTSPVRHSVEPTDLCTYDLPVTSDSPHSRYTP